MRTRLVILRAPPTDFAPAFPKGFTLIRVAAGSCAADQDKAEEAMKAAMEPSGLVAPRLVHGDEFFGWQIGGRVVNFAWVTYRDRMLGPVPLAEAPGRAFPYNGYTLEEYRGRGLYLAVLLTMRFVLGCENVTEFVGDVEVNNTASMNGVHKAGFIPVAQLDYLTLFTHWPCLGKWAVLDPSAASLFPPVRTKGPTWWEHQKKNR